MFVLSGDRRKRVCVHKNRRVHMSNFGQCFVSFTFQQKRVAERPLRTKIVAKMGSFDFVRTMIYVFDIRFYVFYMVTSMANPIFCLVNLIKPCLFWAKRNKHKIVCF